RDRSSSESGLSGAAPEVATSMMPMRRSSASNSRFFITRRSSRGRISAASLFASSTVNNSMRTRAPLLGDLVGLERLAAAARADRVRVADREPCGLQRLDPVHLDALQHRGALRIDEHLHAAELPDPVAGLLGLGERHPV